MTEACLFAEGKQLMAYDEPSKAFLCRINAISAFYCDVRDRLKKQTDEMDTYCPIDPVEPTPPIVIPPPEPACCFTPPPHTPEYIYKIVLTDLDEDAYELLELAEAEACTVMDLITELENTERCSS